MIKVRKQTKADADVVESIIAAATSELRSIYRPKETKIKNITGKATGIVATINNTVVGTAEYLVNTDSIQVHGLAVSPAHRNQGIARAIIEYLALQAQKEAKSGITLSTIKETGKFNAFLRMGFTVTSEAVSEIFEGIQSERVTLVNMSKPSI